MKKLMIATIAIAALCGCRVIKVEHSADGEYRAYYNSHWFSTEADSVTADVSPDGKFSLSLAGVKSDPSEEFNKMMGTTMGTFVQMMQIAAAAYNPSSSAASAAAKTTESAQTVVNVQPAAAMTTSDAQASTNAVESVEAK